MTVTEKGPRRDGTKYPATARYTGRLAIVDTVPSAAVPLEVDIWPAPVMSIPAAVGTLDAGEAAFVFFADRATGRGNVLYRRHDGHYGLITPA